MDVEQIGPYLIQEEISRPGLGRLFRAIEPSQNVQFVLRLLPVDFLKEPGFRAQYIHAMQALEACGHAGVIPSYLIEIDGQDWLVRRWLPGGSLAERIAQGGLIPSQAVTILSQIAAALDAAHTCGVLHQNLKASNVLFDENGAVVLVDFGLVSGPAGDGMKALNWLYGAPETLSPEAGVGAANLDARSDVYSLGALAFELFCGQPPFPARGMLASALHHLNTAPPDLAALRPNLPAGFGAVITRALEKYPAKRFNSAGEFARALEWALQHPRKQPDWVRSLSSIPPGSTAPPAHRQRKSGWLIGMLVLFLAMAALLYVSGTLQRVLPGVNLPAVNLPLQIFQPAPTSLPTTAILLASDTPPPPTSLPSPIASPTSAPTHTAVPTRTPLPTSTLPPTSTPLPAAPSIGGADLLAFINANDIWAVNLDGNGLVRLTDDEEPKTDLQWTPDGKGLIYASQGCYYLLIYPNPRVEKIGCFDDLEISPDMQRFIIGGTVTLPNLNQSWMNYLGALDFGYLSTLSAIPQRSTSNGIAFIGGRLNQFSPYNDLMAAVFKAPQDGRQVDQIQVFRLSSSGAMDIVDNFPAQRFTLSGYSGPNDQPVLSDFGWNGQELFTLHGDILHGYGDLVLYNMDTGLAKTINPITGKCCYQDIQFSPDGQYLLFAFQDNQIGQGAQIYLIPLGLIGSGASVKPIELPFYFFADSRARLEPALRPGE